MKDASLKIEAREADIFLYIEANKNQLQINAGIGDNVSVILADLQLAKLAVFLLYWSNRNLK